MTIFLAVPVGCASFCVPNCSLSVGGKCSSHLASLSLTSRTSYEALAFSLYFPHSFLDAPPSNQWVREGQPLSPKKESLTFHHLGLYCLFPFCLMPLSSSLWSSTSFVRNYFLIFRSYIAGEEESAHVIVHKSKKIGLPGWQLTIWNLPSWWSVYGMNKKDNLCSESGKIAQIEPPRTNHWPVYRTLITEVHQHSSSPGAPAATHEHSDLFNLDTNDTTTSNKFKFIPNGSRTCEHSNILKIIQKQQFVAGSKEALLKWIKKPNFWGCSLTLQITG